MIAYCFQKLVITVYNRYFVVVFKSTFDESENINFDRVIKVFSKSSDTIITECNKLQFSFLN